MYFCKRSLVLRQTMKFTLKLTSNEHVLYSIMFYICHHIHSKMKYKWIRIFHVIFLVKSVGDVLPTYLWTSICKDVIVGKFKSFSILVWNVFPPRQMVNGKDCTVDIHLKFPESICNSLKIVMQKFFPASFLQFFLIFKIWWKRSRI